MSAAAMLGGLALVAMTELPGYPGAELTPIGSRVEVAGQQLWLGAFSTRDPGEAVGRFYAQAFGHQGLPTTVDGDCARACVVTGFRTREGLAESAVVQEGDGITLVFLALQSLWFRTPPGARPEAEGTLGSEVGGAEGSAAVRTSLVPGTPAEAESLVLLRLRAEGFERRSAMPSGRRQADPAEGVRHLELAGPAGRVQVWLAPAGRGQTVVETLMEEGR